MEDPRADNARNMTSAEKIDPDAVVLPRYWVPAEEVARRLGQGEGAFESLGVEPGRGFLAIRRIARATDQSATMLAVLP